MASLLPPPNPAEGRISQLLPTVKCSDCNRLVPIHELGEHVCVSPPSPSTSGPSLSTLLSQRVQEMVSSPSVRSEFSKTPPPKTSSPTPSLASRQAEVSARRSRAFSVSSRKHSPGPIPTLIPPMKPAPTEPLPTPRVPIPEASRSADSVPPHRIPFPASRSNTPNIPVNPSQIRAPSVASSRSVSSHPSIDSRDRTLSDASQLRPSFDSNRPRKSSTATISSLGAGRPSYDIPRTKTPSDNSRSNTPYDQPPPIPPSTPSSVYNPNLPSPGSNIHSVPTPQNNARPRTNGLVPATQNMPPPMMMEQPMFQPIPEPDTKIGGEAGMAGVGRRGFQAFARAAMFTAPPTHLAGRPSPGFLDIQRAVGTYTPPLSPSGNSPISPLSMHSPVDINSELERSLTPRSNLSIASRTPPPVTPVPSQSPPTPDRLSAADYVLPQTPADEIGLSFTRESDTIATVVMLEDKPREKGPRSSDGSDFGGLAYADSDSEHDDGNFSKKDGIQFPTSSPRSSKSSESAYSARIPMRSLSAASSSCSGYGARSTARSVGALDRAMETLFEDAPLSPTTNASFSPLFPTKYVLPAGAEDHNPVRDSSSKPPKLPTRSHTSPTIAKPRELDTLKPSKSVTSNSSTSSSRLRKVKQCASCNKTIDDGRWIPMDGGRVLCDKCWKNMYLPKCRRCNLPIEKQAVSSSDGQLKGKYHRGCFNCHTCHKPFPDKTFYVYDGRPYCAYHYHEANGSLCAASSCGQPIEGPCAVAHSGAKYHPEHLLCEFPRCTARLDEYYEADGKMFCERHASIAEQAALHEHSGDDEDSDVLGLETPKVTTTTMKRTTRFIDIAGLGVR
ncbi:hypothetical protein BDM02DRAFT_696567 [Thelephora ganbajun]|uniref:Uncharacterized protein n=1 Tax=Thelephora ganbajun TaxID=370292 RepID=A0ACB6Z6H6_THEGA|nr:hypothetical protein BDM02DRAFT_696567 [Thelephora ganbajun]